jgi:hypothetical protein
VTDRLDRSYVAKFEIVNFFVKLFFLTLDKSRDSELNGISYNTLEEQCESNYALKVNKLVTSLLRKWPLNVLVNLLLLQHHSHLLKP